MPKQKQIEMTYSVYLWTQKAQKTFFFIPDRKTVYRFVLCKES
jgi:hypothetical protein